MPLFYNRQIRARLLACLDPNQTEVRFASENERFNLIETDQRQIYAEEVTADNPWSDHEGNPIPAGDFAITRSDGTVFGSKRAFFVKNYAPYADFNQPLNLSDLYDIVA